MPKGPQGQKRPGDVIGAAIMVAKIATGEIEEKLGKPKRMSMADVVRIIQAHQALSSTGD